MDAQQEHEKVAQEIGSLPDFTAQILDLIVKECQAEVRGSHFHSDAEGIVRKSLMHLGTLMHLGKGCSMSLTGGTFQYVDFATANCLSRVIFEGCVLLAYVFKTPDKVNRDFWHSVWRLDGHLERRKHLDAPSKDDPKKLLKEVYPTKLAENDSAILALEGKITGHAYYAHIDQKRQARAIKGRWREVEALDKLKYEDLASRAGLDSHFGRSAYSFTSTFIHTTAISIFQVNEAKDRDKQGDLYNGALVKAAGFHLVCLETYAALFDCSVVVAQTLKEGLTKLSTIRDFISK